MSNAAAVPASRGLRPRRPTRHELMALMCVLGRVALIAVAVVGTAVGPNLVFIASDFFIAVISVVDIKLTWPTVLRYLRSWADDSLRPLALTPGQVAVLRMNLAVTPVLILAVGLGVLTSIAPA